MSEQPERPHLSGEVSTDIPFWSTPEPLIQVGDPARDRWYPLVDGTAAIPAGATRLEDVALQPAAPDDEQQEPDGTRSLVQGFAHSRRYVTSPEALTAHPAGCRCAHHYQP